MHRIHDPRFPSPMHSRVLKVVQGKTDPCGLVLLKANSTEWEIRIAMRRLINEWLWWSKSEQTTARNYTCSEAAQIAATVIEGALSWQGAHVTLPLLAWLWFCRVCRFPCIIILYRPLHYAPTSIYGIFRILQSSDAEFFPYKFSHRKVCMHFTQEAEGIIFKLAHYFAQCFVLTSFKAKSNSQCYYRSFHHLLYLWAVSFIIVSVGRKLIHFSQRFEFNAQISKTLQHFPSNDVKCLAVETVACNDNFCRRGDKKSEK